MVAMPTESPPPAPKVSPLSVPSVDGPPGLRLAFAPLHKRAFGIATGAAGALLMSLITAAGMWLPSARDFPLELLNEYFAGYSVSMVGLAVGAAWGFVVAFVAGWFFAFVRNLSLAISAFLITARAELAQTRDFLDHI